MCFCCAVVVVVPSSGSEDAGVGGGCDTSNAAVPSLDELILILVILGLNRPIVKLSFNNRVRKDGGMKTFDPPGMIMENSAE
jgi:hypothetical protein